MHDLWPLFKPPWSSPRSNFRRFEPLCSEMASMKNMKEMKPWNAEAARWNGGFWMAWGRGGDYPASSLKPLKRRSSGPVKQAAWRVSCWPYMPLISAISSYGVVQWVPKKGWRQVSTLATLHWRDFLILLDHNLTLGLLTNQFCEKARKHFTPLIFFITKASGSSNLKDDTKCHCKSSDIFVQWCSRHLI